MSKGKLVLCIAGLLIFMNAAAYGQTIAGWDFQDLNLSVDTTTPNNLTNIITTTSSATAAYDAGPSSTRAASWTDMEVQNASYIEIPVNTTGFSSIVFYYSARTSNTASKYWKLQYSSTGTSGTFTTALPIVVQMGTTFTVNNTFDLSSVTALNNNANVVFRIVATDSVGDGSGTYVQADGAGVPADAGTFRVDDIVISSGLMSPTSTPGAPTNTPNPPTNTPTGPTSTPAPVSAIKINEVFINSPSTDIHCFVELYYPGGISLDGYSLVGVNGSTGLDYNTIPLSGYTIPADGFFVIAQDTGVANWDLIATGVDFQNGPDSIQLRSGATVVDAIGYGVFGTEVFAGEGTPCPVISDAYSYSRLPDGDDLDDNVTDFVIGDLTAGAVNVEAIIPSTNTPSVATNTPAPPTNTPTGPTSTPAPVSAIKINEVFINSPSTDIHCYVELYFPGGISLDGYSLVGVNGNGGVDYNTIDLTGETIPTDGYFVIAQDTGVANWDLIATGVDFQNGPDSIQLRSGATVVDAIGYGVFGTEIFAGEGTPCPVIPTEYSYSRIPDGEDLDDNAVDFFVGELTSGLTNVEAVIPPTATPGGPTNTPSVATSTPAPPTSTPSGPTQTPGPIPPIKINEILVDPDGADDNLEWIEIINTSAAPVDVTGVIIQSTTGTDQAYTDRVTLPAITIPANGFLLVAESLVDVSSVPLTTEIYQPTSPGLNIDFQNASSHTEGARLVTNAHDVIDTLIFSNPNEPNIIAGDLPEDPNGEHFALRPMPDNSLARCPDGSDSNLCDEDFVRRDPTYITIGDANNCEVPTPTPTPTGPTPTPPPTEAIKLNEVYINPPGTDVGCFVELYFPGGMALTGYSLVGVNGYDGSEYIEIDLSTYSIPADGYLVIAQDDTVPNYDAINPLVNFQNGPDSIQIKFDSVVVDAIGYGDFTGMIFGGEGDPAPAFFVGAYSHSRIPDGDDTEDNLVDFVMGELTSGLANVIADVPTPTPPAQVPASSPTGIGIMIVMISVLIGWSLARARN